jgi:hypothetical protein
LNSDDDAIVIDSTWGISYLTDGNNDKIQAIVDHGFVPRLVQLLQHSNQDVHIPALRAVGNIVTGGGFIYLFLYIYIYIKISIKILIKISSTYRFHF